MISVFINFIRTKENKPKRPNRWKRIWEVMGVNIIIFLSVFVIARLAGHFFIKSVPLNWWDAVAPAAVFFIFLSAEEISWRIHTRKKDKK